MTSSPPDRLFWDEYVSAETCFDEGDWEGCINKVKKNLDDSALPPFYLIKNCILIACAVDKWDEADTYRATAEDAYNKALREAEDAHDEDMIVMLGDLRSELDELEDFKREDIAMQTLDPQHLSQYWHADPNEDTSVYSQELQDEMQALTEVANELKEVAEAILLSNQVLMEAAGTQNPDQETHNDRHNELQRTLMRLRRRQAHLAAAVNGEIAKLQSQRRMG